MENIVGNSLKRSQDRCPTYSYWSKGSSPLCKECGKNRRARSKGTAEFVAKHPKTSLVAGAVSLPYFGYNKGALTFAKEKLLGNDSKEKGLVDTASRLAFGEQKDAYGNEKSISEKAVNVLLAKVPMIQSKEQEEPPSTRGRNSTIILKTVW